jgi:hypothetical protein
VALAVVAWVGAVDAWVGAVDAWVRAFVVVLVVHIPCQVGSRQEVPVVVQVGAYHPSLLQIPVQPWGYTSWNYCVDVGLRKTKIMLVNRNNRKRCNCIEVLRKRWGNYTFL